MNQLVARAILLNMKKTFFHRNSHKAEGTHIKRITMQYSIKSLYTLRNVDILHRYPSIIVYWTFFLPKCSFIRKSCVVQVVFRPLLKLSTHLKTFEFVPFIQLLANLSPKTILNQSWPIEITQCSSTYRYSILEGIVHSLWI